MKTLLITALLMVSGMWLSAQINGFYDGFEDGKPDTLWDGHAHLLWKADHPHTFGLREELGLLHIDYLRNEESAAWDNFNFTPPENILVEENPRISLKVKSDVATTLTLKPIYSNGEHDWIPRDIPGDGRWAEYSFDLLAENHGGGSLVRLYLYLDGGSTEPASGLVQVDNFQIAGFSLSILDLVAEVSDSVSVQLSWKPSNADHTALYRIYRGQQAGMESLLAESEVAQFMDSGLEENTTYYYKVSAVDSTGREHSSSSISVRTFNPLATPTPSIEGVNSSTVGRYEKFEIRVGLLDGNYDNPYDPDQIDLYAWFTSPSGDSLRINGFYDNYQNAEQWKVRFAAHEEGTWTFRLHAANPSGSGFSEEGSFQVEASEHKGWIQVSPDNPNYLVHDDGSSFYGMAVYYPWNTTEAGLDKFEAVEGNFFGYWDCTFDGAGNGGGRYLLESMQSGLGRYDQRKAARIDQVLEMAEARDMKVMYALWTHPYLRIDNVPWDNGRWHDHNPYSSIVEPEDFYSDSLALAYQDKHHRYAIARFGYSRALGIWELINEAHGTTGWVRDRAGTKEWVERAHLYFKENDPFQRPTTVSFGGGEGASHFTDGGDLLGDMPNVHFYEQHGWTIKYPGNLIRSGLHNVVTETRKLKQKGDRPVFFGEAGYDHMLADHGTEAYTWEMHNAFWAGLCNGMATTPFWWELNTTEIITQERLQEYRSLNKFVEDIDLAHHDFQPLDLKAEQADAYFMGTENQGFGWLYCYDGSLSANLPVYTSGSDLENGSYLVQWYHSRTGEVLDQDTSHAVEGHSWSMVTPLMDQADAAFKLKALEAGGAATGVYLKLVESDTLVNNPSPWLPKVDSTILRVVCYVLDDEGLLDVSYHGPVDFKLVTAGQTVQISQDLVKGGTVLHQIDPGVSGISIRALVEGLGEAELYLEGSGGTGLAYREAGQAAAKLGPAYPNPFEDFTHIPVYLGSTQWIELEVYNQQGQLLETLANETRPAGIHEFAFSAQRHPGGMHLLVLRTQALTQTQKLILQ